MNLPIFQARTGFSRPLARLLAAALPLVLLSACSSVEEQRIAYVSIAAAENPQEVGLLRPFSGMLINDAKVDLPVGSRWTQIGAVPQGDLYRRADTVFTIDARRWRETYLVISDGALNGVYFPGDTLYMPLPKPSRLYVKKN